MTNTTSQYLKIAAALAAGFFMMSPANATDSVTNGAKIYSETCIACHGANGEGTVPGAPNFTRVDGRLSKKTAVLIDHITNGFQTPGVDLAMPPLGGNQDLTEQDVEDVLAYLRATFQHKK